ncbi:HAMP domain-containing sensor histidine kinase [Sulfurimonas sp.]|uniref:sensor histidine kinase n=1 Tax=Sulfurimonas sp. TaxID=2022749 RepID=UPI0025F2FDC1|nr:HAMP domain-containing sensor histidine kinase [Sulfurimonas sp.]MDD5158147.1 HAMP domain-containing sensor histidine kinase [Sulfurimonas sp.]
MLKIHQIFIVNFLVLLVSSLLVSSIISYIALKSIVIERSKNHLKNSIELIELEMDGVKNLDEFVFKIKKKALLRVTIIDSNGIVLAETDADKKEMDNHLSRFEIMQSNSQKYGEITRYSDTVRTDYLYIVKKISLKDKQVYLRLSMGLTQIMSDFYSLWIKLFFVFMAIVIVGVFISRRMSQKIVYDISQITNYLDEVSNKNYNTALKVRYFHEFLQISIFLKNLVKKLHKNEKKKNKNMAKLRLLNKQRYEILSAISHEFKNPIASIIGYAQTIKDDTQMSPKIRDRFLEKISLNGEKISKMLDRLALSVKLENGDLAINKSEFSLKQLCDEVVSGLLLKYKDREIVVFENEVTVFTDKAMLEIILVNLIENALKYSRDEVKVIFKNSTIFVKDRGIGIKEENLSRVTKKFYRVDKNSWDNSMGIGLAMVSYILKSLNASLKIESKYSKGSIFSFSIDSMIETK